MVAVALHRYIVATWRDGAGSFFAADSRFGSGILNRFITAAELTSVAAIIGRRRSFLGGGVEPNETSRPVGNAARR